MEDNERSIRSLIVRYLIAHTQCNGCGRRYAPRDVRVYSRRGDVWLASVTCRHCGLQGLVMAAIATDELEEVDEAVAESAKEEIEAFQDFGPILGDEILDLHLFLEQFDGNMVELLSEGNVQ
jgi:hypothetical protein